MLRLISSLVLALLALIAPAHADDVEAAWAALGRGAIALMRHPDTDGGGSGDPPGFRLDDCGTQRPLNARGRQKAKDLGTAWRRRGLKVQRMLSSQWCRCIETAILMDISPMQPFAPLNNVSGRPGEAVAAQVAALRRLVAEWQGPNALVLITHNSTIAAFAGLSPAEGEVVVIEPQPDSERGFRVVGRIPPPG
jgi:broad specificity phosphatase PhoE